MFPEPFGHDRAEGELRAERFGKDVGLEHQVGEALQARRASGYKVRWRISWGQVAGWLIVAVVVGGLLLLLVHSGAEH